MLRHVIPQPRVAYRDQVYTCDTHTRMSPALSAGGDCCHAKASNSPGHARNHSCGATSKAPSCSSLRVYPPFVHQPTPISVLSRLLPCSLPRTGCSVPGAPLPFKSWPSRSQFTATKKRRNNSTVATRQSSTHASSAEGRLTMVSRCVGKELGCARGARTGGPAYMVNMVGGGELIFAYGTPTFFLFFFAPCSSNRQGSWCSFRLQSIRATLIRRHTKLCLAVEVK